MISHPQARFTFLLVKYIGLPLVVVGVVYRVGEWVGVW